MAIPTYESVTNGRTDRFKVRIWRVESALRGVSRIDIREALAVNFEAQTETELFEELKLLPKVVRVEITDINGDGFVIDMN